MSATTIAIFLLFCPLLVSSDDMSKSANWDSFQKLLQDSLDGLLNKRLSALFEATRRMNLTSECASSLTNVLLSLRNLKGWAVFMADANGKVPSGILDGTAMDLGSYDECLSIRVNDSEGEEEFRGRFCMVGIKSPLLATMDKRLSDGRTYQEAFGVPPEWIAMILNRTGAYLKHTAFWFGTCVPSTCTEKDVRKISTFVTKPLNVEILMAGCKTDEYEEYPSSVFIAICILGTLFGLSALGTLADTASRLSKRVRKRNSILLRILKSFSVISNTELLFATTSGEDVLGCFHGIRFLSATWIILGHTYFYTDTWKFLKYRNALEICDKFRRFLPLAVIENFTIPVGSFFFMSGFLLVYVEWRKLQKYGELNIINFFLHKYWRMTPSLLFLVALFLALPLVGDGPLWDSTLNRLLSTCETRWWKNFLYINNLWNTDQYCLLHTWYLAVLMQFHLFGVCLLHILYRSSFLGVLVSATTLIASCIATGMIMVWNNYPMPASGIVKDMDIMEDYNSKIYIKPFAHTPSYLTGMLVGFLYLKYKNRTMSSYWQILCWVLAVASALVSVYGLYLPEESMAVRATYIAIHRLLWAVGVGWLVYACITHKGGMINRILSWPAFSSLGQLSYLVYLLHPLIMLYKTATLRERIYFGHVEMVSEFLTLTVIAFFMAYIGHVTVERPFLILDKLLTSAKTTPSKYSNNNLSPQANGYFPK